MPFESDLELRHRPGHRRWELVRQLQFRHYAPTPAQPAGYQPRASQLIVVPIGYLSDLASVPRLARWLIDREEPEARRPSVIHDFIYTHLTHRFTKVEADRIFYDALREEGMNTALAWLMWKAVRLGGRGTWST
ncbi:DUF1353 domain-containing protein [Pseudomonas sp. NPDC087697]|uniref:DUF1353 domain-containing protein n=1 Tax=Pseudomonas sp. NPDC087697 TaxID=3364447 RepID=UPI0038286F02